MKRKALIVSISLAVVFGSLHFFGSTRIPPLYTLKTEIMLPASPEQSWEVLTDFARYPEWNPYLPRVETEMAVGATVSFTLVDDNFPEPFDLTARLGELSANTRFYWVGRLGIQGLFDTKHVFELRPRDDGNTDLHHYEEFRGLIPALLPDRERRSGYTLAAFESMNKALYQRLEESTR